jgi:hypothetical protein
MIDLAGGLTFVVSTDLAKPSADTRKFIRSHVMLGKNLGKTLPSKKPIAQEPSPPTSDEEECIKSLAPEAFTSSSSLESLALAPSSRQFSSLLATISLADTVDVGKIDSVLKFSQIAKQVLFPLEPCIFFERRAEEWIGPLTTDPAYLHCLIFTSSYFFDALRHSSSPGQGMNVPINQQMMPHYIKGLRLLRDRMGSEDDPARCSNTTAAAVMGLSAHSMAMGDMVFARKHLDGLGRIVRLRGGTGTFGGAEKLLVEILRTDLGLALITGFKSVVLSGSEIDEPLLQPSDLEMLLVSYDLAIAETKSSFPWDVDLKLAETWKMMADFCTLINFAADTGLKISTQTFLHAMTFVMYRLISMNFPNHPRNDMIRLGLLAFASSVFLQWRSIGMPYTHFATAFKKRLTFMMAPNVSSKLDLWMMMVGAISLLEIKDDWWLRPLFLFNVSVCGVETWEDMRKVMMEFLWIDLVHDRPGRMVFERLMAGD